VFWFRAPIALTSLLFLRGLRSAQGAAARNASTSSAHFAGLRARQLVACVDAGAAAGRPDYLALFLIRRPLRASSPSCGGGRAAQPIVRVELFRITGFAIVNLAMP